MQTNAISLVVQQYSVLFKVQTIPAPCMKFCWLRNKYSLASVIKVFFFLILTQKMPKRIKYILPKCLSFYLIFISIW